MEVQSDGGGGGCYINLDYKIMLHEEVLGRYNDVITFSQFCFYIIIRH